MGFRLVNFKGGQRFTLFYFKNITNITCIYVIVVISLFSVIFNFKFIAMIKKLLNIYDEDLYLRIQLWAKTHKTDANAFINKAMEEKMAAIENGSKVAKMVEEAATVNDFDDQITEVDFEDDKTF